jgi:protein involved in polysaccharide export with SLBB domain
MASFRSIAPLQQLCALVLMSLTMAIGVAVLPASAQTPTESAASSLYEYRLGSADKVRITVFGEESLTGEFLVSGAGRISMPLIGEVPAAGLTVAQLQTAVEAKLADGYLRMPRVSAEVLNYRPFYILGEVNKPGEYPYTNQLTVLNAVATAEGFTYRANTRRVFIKRAEATTEQEFPLTQATEVEPGDTIRITERFF